MKDKYIYIVRHGETDYNRRGIVQGSGLDSDINNWGRAQAMAFYDSYQHVPFDKIYTSGLKRTQQSVQKFIDSDVPVEHLPMLNEISWGIYEGMVSSSVGDPIYWDLIFSWKNGDYNKASENGESPNEVRKRLSPFIELLISRTSERNVLVAIHGRVLRILLTMLLDEPLSEMDQYPHSNLCLYKLVYSYEEERFRIETPNDLTHLMALSIP